jgi:hypothetical protein
VFASPPLGPNPGPGVRCNRGFFFMFNAFVHVTAAFLFL